MTMRPASSNTSTGSSSFSGIDYDGSRNPHRSAVSHFFTTLFIRAPHLISTQANTSLQIRSQNHHRLSHRQQAGRVPEIEHEQGDQVGVPDVSGVVLNVVDVDEVVADLEQRLLELCHAFTRFEFEVGGAFAESVP